MFASLESQLHNQAVSFALNNMLEIPAEPDQFSFAQTQVQMYFSSLGWITPSTTFPTFPDDFDTVDLGSWVSGWVASTGASSNYLAYIYQLVGALQAQPSLSQLYSVTQNIVNSAQSNLTQSELQALVDVCYIGNSSQTFWLSESNGVRCWTNGLQIPIPPPATMAKINWWKVGGCDLVGAAGGAIMAGPKGALVGAAVSSICSAINQL
jgi:hypothetical protein